MLNRLLQVFRANAPIGYLIIRLSIYFVLGYITMRLSTNPNGIAIAWFANAWGAAALVDNSYRRWPASIIYLTFLSFAVNMSVGTSLAVSGLFTIVNMYEVVLIALTLRKLKIWPNVGKTPVALTKLLTVGIALPAMLTATLAGFVLSTVAGGFGAAYVNWFSGSIVGGVSILPFLAATCYDVDKGVRPTWMHWKSLLMASLSVMLVMFFLAFLHSPFVYTAAALVLVAIVTSFGGTALAVLLCITTTSLCVASGYYKFAPSPNLWSEIPNYLTAIVTGTPSLLLSVYVQSNRQHAEQLEVREQDLRVELKRRRALFENSSDSLLLLDSSLCVIDENSRMKRMLGYSEVELRKLTISDYFVGYTEARLYERLDGNPTAVVTFETDLRRKDGSTFPVEITSSEPGNENRKIWILAFRDISERRLSDERIKGLLDFRQKILDASPAGVIVYRVDGQCQLANEAASRITGISHDKLVTQNFHKIKSWKQHGLYALAIRALSSEQTENAIIYLETSGDKDLWLDCYLKRFEDAGEQRLLLMFSDNSERIRAEAELKQTQHDLQNIMDAVPSMIGYWDSNRINRFTNSAYYDQFGYPVETIPGKHMSEILGDKLYNQVLPRIEAVLGGQRQIFEGLLPENIHGEQRHTLINYVPDFREDKVVGFYVLVHDISTVKAAETELKRTLAEVKEAHQKTEIASRAKSEFVANMSHEIRTPMNAILGQLQLLQKKDLTDQQTITVERILTSAKALLHLLNAILDFAKVENGGLRLEERSFSLNSVLQNVLHLFAPSVDPDNITFTVTCDDAIDTNIIGDSLRLEQVLNNLVGNAIKFTEHGEILLSAQLVEKMGDALVLKFSVRDTGIGLSTTEQECLFEAFTQADSSINRRYGGTGLGLAICKNLVELMDGTFSVKSAPGQGSVFTFTAQFKRVNDSKRTQISPTELALMAKATSKGKSELSNATRADLLTLQQLLNQHLVIPHESVAALQELRKIPMLADPIQKLLNALEMFDYEQARYILDLILQDFKK